MDPFTLYLPSSYTQNYLLQDISGDSEDNTACGKQSVEFSKDKTSASRWDEISVMSSVMESPLSTAPNYMTTQLESKVNLTLK